MDKNIIKAMMKVVLQVKDIKPTKLLIDINDESEMIKCWKKIGRKQFYKTYRQFIVKTSIDNLEDIPTTCKKLLDN